MQYKVHIYSSYAWKFLTERLCFTGDCVFYSSKLVLILYTCMVVSQWDDLDMVKTLLSMWVLVGLSVLVHIDMVLEMLVSGVMAMEVVVVGRMVLEGVTGKICCY